MRFTVSVATAILALPAVLAIPNGAAVTVTKMKVITKTKTDIITRTKVETVMRTIYETCLTSASTPVSNTTSGASSSVPITTTSSVNTEEYPTSTAVATATGTQGLNDYAKAAGKTYFGTAADIPGPEQQDVAYMTQLNNTHDFGQLTPANYMKACRRSSIQFHFDKIAVLWS